MLQIKSVRKTFNETVILQEISLLCEYSGSVVKTQI